MELLIIMVVFIGLMYVLMVLPQKRKADQQKKLLNEIQPGTRVMLNTGMFGTVRVTGDQQMVVELAPGVEVTVVKQAVLRTTTADEEEFEYSDPDAVTTGDQDADVEDASVADDDQLWQLNPEDAAGVEAVQVGDDQETDIPAAVVDTDPEQPSDVAPATADAAYTPNYTEPTYIEPAYTPADAEPVGTEHTDTAEDIADQTSASSGDKGPDDSETRPAR
ncbi:hypothetical protein GCM10009785_31910 [Brooklawnia cerclae]|uniref:Preprotein translocase subunit YajC n=1 Tax=Brooklawnia cerclae TaxID=349934 RepID=A0ABX0SDP6_9ACTN|nr:preprotein translocase subunit YajC [Brooklawnia cerclae]NIH56517.1 preprotein translocase subunit YajC [Brooklawnia cerclae]